MPMGVYVLIPVILGGIEFFWGYIRRGVDYGFSCGTFALAIGFVSMLLFSTVA